MNRRGITLIELLVVMAILALVLGLLVSYFVQQVGMTNRIQARNEVQDKVRVVMQVVTQDLQMTGASQYTDASGAMVATAFDSCSVTTCLTAANSGVLDTFSVRYITSLRSSADACRTVNYDFDSTTLRRSDVACGSDSSFNDLADNILAMDIRYTCTDGTVVDSYPKRVFGYSTYA